MTKRTRVLLGLGFLASVGATGSVLVFWLATPADPQEFLAIEKGMTRDAVTAIFGRLPDQQFEAISHADGKMAPAWYWNVEIGIGVWVAFDSEGRVRHKAIFRNEGRFAKLLRFLG
jgi:hypothetical protein